MLRFRFSERFIVMVNSQYRINGQAVRRKDVTALFLGSGLGPRSYAIIEQGMVSRLIESSPAQLRAFIDEAVGVSRYQEKRREVERHLNHTRDNLNRLNDIRVQHETRLQTLKAQAEQAQIYKELRAQQRQTRTHLLYGLWYSWNEAHQSAQAKHNTLEQEQQSLETQKTQLEQQIIDAQTLVGKRSS